MVTGLTALARRSLLRTNTLHFQSATYGAGTRQESERGFKRPEDTYREPLVGFAFSSFSAVGLRTSESPSLRAFFLESLPDGAGLLPLPLDDVGNMCSVGGVPMVSDPCEEGEE